jgi:hypothetical protein
MATTEAAAAAQSSPDESSSTYDTILLATTNRMVNKFNSIRNFFPLFPHEINPFSMEHKQVLEHWLQSVVESIVETSEALTSFPWTNSKLLLKLIRTCEIFYLKVMYVVPPTIDRADALQESMRLRARAWRALRSPLKNEENIYYFFEEADPSIVAKYILNDDDDDSGGIVGEEE